MRSFLASLFSEEGHDLEEAAEQVLLGYEWPGNIRELQNVMERGMILAQGGTGYRPAECGQVELSDNDPGKAQERRIRSVATAPFCPLAQLPAAPLPARTAAMD